MKHRSVVAAVLITLAACAEPFTAAPVRQPGDRDAYLPDEGFAVAIGLRPLRDTELRRGEREMRLWPTAGNIIPSRFVRVIDRHGMATAELYAYWEDPQVHEDSVFASFEPELIRSGRCREIRHAEDYGYCVEKTASPREARAMVAYLDSIGGWNGADTDPHVAEQAAGQLVLQFDGSGVTVEIRRGKRYDAADYAERHMTPGSVGERLYDLPSRF